MHTHSNAEPLPIWMAALIASACQVLGLEGARRIDWQCVAGQAIYTNGGSDVEVLLPFGVPVRAGQTVVVTWTPGDSGYTVRLTDTDAMAA